MKDKINDIVNRAKFICITYLKQLQSCSAMTLVTLLNRCHRNVVRSGTDATYIKS